MDSKYTEMEYILTRWKWYGRGTPHSINTLWWKRYRSGKKSDRGMTVEIHIHTTFHGAVWMYILYDIPCNI